MTELSCRDVLEFLAEYLDQELDPVQRRAFDAHLAECDACVAYIRSYEQALRLGATAFDEIEANADPQVVKRLVEAVLAARRQS
jgi:anti-sigma factor RsiW